MVQSRISRQTGNLAPHPDQYGELRRILRQEHGLDDPARPGRALQGLAPDAAGGHRRRRDRMVASGARGDAEARSRQSECVLPLGGEGRIRAAESAQGRRTPFGRRGAAPARSDACRREGLLRACQGEPGKSRTADSAAGYAAGGSHAGAQGRPGSGEGPPADTVRQDSRGAAHAQADAGVALDPRGADADARAVALPIAQETRSAYRQAERPARPRLRCDRRAIRAIRSAPHVCDANGGGPAWIW